MTNRHTTKNKKNNNKIPKLVIIKRSAFFTSYNIPTPSHTHTHTSAFCKFKKFKKSKENESNIHRKRAIFAIIC